MFRHEIEFSFFVTAELDESPNSKWLKSLMLNLLENEEPKNFLAKFKLCLAAKFMTSIVDKIMKSESEVKYRRSLDQGIIIYTFLTKNTKFFLGQG